MFEPQSKNKKKESFTLPWKWNVTIEATPRQAASPVQAQPLTACIDKAGATFGLKERENDHLE